MKILLAGVILALSLLPLVPALADELPAETLSPILITELQTAAADNASEEFVELYNTSDSALELTDWELHYKSATGTNWTLKATLSGAIEPRGYYTLATAGYLDDISLDELNAGLAASGGHVRVVLPADAETGADEIIYDLLGWGTADSPEGEAALAPSAGESLKRLVDNEELEFIDTDDNRSDFQISPEPNPQSTLPESEPEEDTEPEPEEDSDPTEYATILLSELLIDPASPATDAEDEFIELYNPNDTAVDLSGYTLETGSSFSYGFEFDGLVIGPKSYLVVYAVDTDLVLANGGGAARLLDPNGAVLDSTIYEAAKTSEVWALIGGVWEFSNQPTPNAVNLASVVSAEEGEDNGLKPCALGQFRNPETNRCKKIDSTAATLKPCGPGEFRNPETNRCKQLDSGSSLKPCGPDQVRNPATNRCIKQSCF